MYNLRSNDFTGQTELDEWNAIADADQAESVSSTSWACSSARTLDAMLLGVLLIEVVGVQAMTSEGTPPGSSSRFAAAMHALGVLAARATVVGAEALITGAAAAFLSFFSCMTLLRRHRRSSTSSTRRRSPGSPAWAAPRSRPPTRRRTIIRHTAAAVYPRRAWSPSSSAEHRPVALCIRPYLPLYIVSHSLGATGVTTQPGMASFWTVALEQTRLRRRRRFHRHAGGAGRSTSTDRAHEQRRMHHRSATAAPSGRAEEHEPCSPSRAARHRPRTCRPPRTRSGRRVHPTYAEFCTGT